MTRQQFRLLVLFNQLCSLGWHLVEEAARGAIPEELRAYFGFDQSVIETPADYDPAYGDLLYTVFIGVTLLAVVAAVGLCLGRNWGRRLYVFCVACEILLTPLSPYSIVTGWGGLVGSLYSITAGMVLALAYFSPARRMFPREADGADA